MVEIECGMRKNSFWLSLNPRAAPKRPRRRPLRRWHPRHPCTRRRVSSEALGASGAPDAKKRKKPRTGHQPRRRPPLPFVSSSSSSLVSCGFPLSFLCVLRSGVRFPKSLLRTALRSPSIGFKTGKSCSPELAFRCRFRGVSFHSTRCRPFRLPPRSVHVGLSSGFPASPSDRLTGFCRLRSSQVRRLFGSVRSFRFTTRSRPPVPLVRRSFCS